MTSTRFVVEAQLAKWHGWPDRPVSSETPAASYHPNPRISRYHRWYRCQTPCLHALLHWCVSCQYQPDECILSSWSCCWHPLLQLQQWSHRNRSHLLVADRVNLLGLCSSASMAATMYHDGWRRCCWRAKVGWLVGWLVGSRGVACPADQGLETEKPSAVNFFLFEEQASHRSLLQRWTNPLVTTNWLMLYISLAWIQS